MKPSTSRYLIAVAILALVCSLLQYIWNTRMPQNMHLADGYILLGIFAVIVTAVHLFLLNVSENAPGTFVQSFIASTAIKFMIYMSVLIGFLLYSKDNKKALVLHFLFYYAVFTVLEVSMLYKELSARKKL